MVTAGEILTSLSAEFTLTPDGPDARGSAPAETFQINGGPDRVGIIWSVTRPFCGTCDRVRLTADGQVRNCLFAPAETDLRAALRSGASDDQLAELWRTAVAAKRPGHGINDPGFLQPARPMSAIGGSRPVDWRVMRRGRDRDEVGCADCCAARTGRSWLGPPIPGGPLSWRAPPV